MRITRLGFGLRLGAATATLAMGFSLVACASITSTDSSLTVLESDKYAVWTVEHPTETGGADPVLVGDLFAVSDGSGLSGISATTGEPAWSTAFPEMTLVRECVALTAPQPSDSVVACIIGTESTDELVRVNAATGERLGSLIPVASYSQLSAAGDLAIVASVTDSDDSDSFVHAYTADGEEAWSYDILADAKPGEVIGSYTVTVAGGHVGITVFRDAVHLTKVLDASDGHLVSESSENPSGYLPGVPQNLANTVLALAPDQPTAEIIVFVEQTDGPQHISVPAQFGALTMYGCSTEDSHATTWSDDNDYAVGGPAVLCGTTDESGVLMGISDEATLLWSTATPSRGVEILSTSAVGLLFRSSSDEHAFLADPRTGALTDLGYPVFGDTFAAVEDGVFTYTYPVGRVPASFAGYAEGGRQWEQDRGPLEFGHVKTYGDTAYLVTDRQFSRLKTPV